MARPIPKRMLPSVCEVRQPRTNELGYQEHGEPVRMVGVRYEQCATLRATQYMLQDGTKGIMYVDAVNTVGAFEVLAGAMVRIDGAEVEQCANAVHEFRAEGGAVHHWEVELR